LRYVGILRSGDNEETDIAIGTIAQERILPEALQDLLYLSGTIRNKGLNTLLVRFYVNNREAQFITLAPNEDLEIKNVPCSRLILQAVGGLTTTEYYFTMVDTQLDSEDNTMLLYADIKKKTPTSEAEAAAISRHYYPELVGLDKGKEVGELWSGVNTVTGTERNSVLFYYEPSGQNFQLDLNDGNRLDLTKQAEDSAGAVTLKPIYTAVPWSIWEHNRDLEFVEFVSSYVPFNAPTTAEFASILGSSNVNDFLGNNEAGFEFRYQTGQTWKFRHATIATNVIEVDTGITQNNLTQYCKLNADGTAEVKLFDSDNEVYSETVDTGIILHQQIFSGRPRWRMQDTGTDSAFGALYAWLLRCG